MTRLDDTGHKIANNFTSLGMPVEYVKGIENIFGDVFYFNLLNINQYNEKAIATTLEKISVYCHADLRFGTTDEAHFKVEWVYKNTFKLPLDNILDRNKIVIGLDTDNKPISIDFKNTPHLLVAGTTGSGKSVLLKTLFCSIYNYYNQPNGSRFKNAQYIIIDPKGNEFNEFRNVVDNYIVETPHAINALRQLEDIMDNRYRNITSIKTPMFIIIDELADLMLTSRFEVERSIVRIAQKGRACDMHLIVATQRPSVDVCTGLIKANLPCRLALKTASVRDSVVIMDKKGSEVLVGNGDCLYKHGLTERHFKVAYPSEDLIKRIIK